MGLFDKLKKQPAEPEIIIESNSPVTDIQAFVEKSDTCYYFYLWGNPTSERKFLKSCWICNRQRAPKELDAEAMKLGCAPMMPEEYVAHDIEGMELDADKLEIVWFAEGDGASLLCNGELICVIPGWADAEKRFFGYSRYAKGTGNYAWELTRAEATLMSRTQTNQAFWKYFDTDFWPEIQTAHMAVLEQFFGKHERYFAIDGGKFPPKALISGSRDGVVYGITAGVSLIPMPQVEQYMNPEEVAKHHRIELGFATTEQYRPLCDHFYSAMSSLAAYPWQEITFFAHGHTVPYRGIKGFEALLFINPRVISEVEQPAYKDFVDDEVSLLWLMPITAQEYELAMNEGSQALLQHAEDLKRVHIFEGIPKFI